MKLIALPSPRDERWKRADLSALPILANERPSGRLPSLDEHWLSLPGPKIVFVDGRFIGWRSALGPVVIREVDPRSGAHALGRLAGTKGWSLEVPSGLHVAGAVQILHVSTGGANSVAARLRVGEGARASIVETFVGEGWANRAASVELDRRAEATIVRRLIQTGGFQSVADTMSLGTEANLVSISLAAGGGDVRLDGHLTLEGVGGRANLGGALLGRGSQRHDAVFNVRHAVPQGTTRQIWRVVADGLAVCSASARVEVARGAQKTDGEQSLRGILLARTARANLKPELEIFADDVQCGHGATVGELDREALFYLASRGIGPTKARALLTRAFVTDAVAAVEDPTVREALKSNASDWLSRE